MHILNDEFELLKVKIWLKVGLHKVESLKVELLEVDSLKVEYYSFIKVESLKVELCIKVELLKV